MTAEENTEAIVAAAAAAHRAWSRTSRATRADVLAAVAAGRIWCVAWMASSRAAGG